MKPRSQIQYLKTLTFVNANCDHIQFGFLSQILLLASLAHSAIIGLPSFFHRAYPILDNQYLCCSAEM